MLRILFIACGFDGGKSGISVYMREVLSRMAKENRVTVLVTHRDRRFLPDDPNVEYKVLSPRMDRALFNMLYVWFLPLFFRKKEFDVLFLPAVNRRAPGWRKWFSVGVVHDLSQFHVPAKYDRFRMFYVKRLLPYAARRIDRVVAISESTASDLVNFWKIGRERITLNYNGYDSSVFHREYSAENGKKVLEKYHLDAPFLLYISRIEHPGKNHLRLIQAFEALPEELRDKYELVLGGSKWTGADLVIGYAADSFCRDRIRFIDFVPSEDLPVLYHEAALYVCPSLFEGFGLSIPEAMACGCITACSNNSSLKEVAGNAAGLFDPESVPEMSSVIASCLSDGQLRRTLRERGFRRVSLFNWDRHVQCLTQLAGECYFRKNTLQGITYDNISMQNALDFLRRTVLLKERKKIAFVNADCFNQAYRNSAYRNALERFDCILPDGSGVALAGRILRRPVRENVNGTDMLPLLAGMAEKEGFSLYLLGAAPGVAERMRENLLKRWPALKIAGCHDGYQLDHIADVVNETFPDILLVAMGVPRQELFIDENFKKLNCRIAMGVGGLFDFYSGNMPRAPKWLRRLGLEWCFRLAMEPRRMFRRYVIGNPLFVLRTVFKGVGR